MPLHNDRGAPLKGQHQRRRGMEMRISSLGPPWPTYMMSKHISVEEPDPASDEDTIEVAPALSIYKTAVADWHLSPLERNFTCSTASLRNNIHSSGTGGPAIQTLRSDCPSNRGGWSPRQTAHDVKPIMT